MFAASEESVQKILEIVTTGGARGVTLEDLARRYSPPGRGIGRLSGLAAWLGRFVRQGLLVKGGRGRFARYAVTPNGERRLSGYRVAEQSAAPSWPWRSPNP